jgi:hypothetical protein
MLPLYTKPQIIQTLPVYTMPNQKAVSSDIGNQFRARPLLQWRKQYPATFISSRLSIGMPMDRPGSSATATTNHCPACRGAATLRTDIFQDSPCKSCQPIRTKTQFKENTYTDTPEYLQSRCLTNTQQFSTSREPAVIYFTPEGRPTNPSDSPTGSQIRATRNCNNSLVKYIDAQLEKYIKPLVKCNTTVIYKPNNTQYAQQGGVSASSRLSRLKYNTLNNNGAAFNSAAGAVNINSGRYQTVASPDYYVKYKPQPNVCLRKSGAKNLCITGYSKYVEPPQPFQCSIMEVNGGIFASQAELETIRGCSKVNGDIEIASNFDGQPDFTVFDCLKEITGSINFYDNSFTSISGFPRLTTINGNLIIKFNAVLNTISGFPLLTSVAIFVIGENAALKTISGFPLLTSINAFGIFGNAALITISGFPKLTTIGEYFEIVNNNSLNTISEFVELTSVNGFTIFGNADLITISGFPKLTTIGEYFEIFYNNSLTSIPEFTELTSVGFIFSIEENANLITISGFPKLTSIVYSFNINRNNSLTEISGFPKLTTIGGFFYIGDNNSLTTISEFVELTTIGGNLTIDNNGLFAIPGPSPNYIVLIVSAFPNLILINGEAIINGYGEFNQTQITIATDNKIASAVGFYAYNKNIYTKVFG